MLIQTNHDELGDKRLNPEEGLAKFKEENATLVQNRRLHKQDELEDQERSAGPRLAYQEVIRRLLKCNSGIRVKDGSLGNVALYAVLPNEEGVPEQQYVGGMPKEPLPEYSHIIVDERGLPKRELRGWRSVLMSLVKSGAITYRGAVKQFGEATGQRSWRWHEQLRKYKG
jgi:hypothetical protein